MKSIRTEILELLVALTKSNKIIWTRKKRSFSTTLNDYTIKVKESKHDGRIIKFIKGGRKIEFVEVTAEEEESMLIILLGSLIQDKIMDQKTKLERETLPEVLNLLVGKKLSIW